MIMMIEYKVNPELVIPAYREKDPDEEDARMATILMDTGTPAAGVLQLAVTTR